MASEHDDSSSTLEKLILLVFIAAIIVGNVTRPVMNDARMILSDLDLRFYHLPGSISSKALVQYQRLGYGID